MKSLEMNLASDLGFQPLQGILAKELRFRGKGLKLTEGKWFYDALGN